MFVIQCALKRLLYNKKISLIFILSIAAGLICPFYILGYIHTSAAMDAMNRYESADESWLVNGSLKVMEGSFYNDVEDFIGTPLKDYECIYETTMGWEHGDGVDSVGGVSLGILGRVPVYLKEGRLFEQKDYEQDAMPVCILKSTSEMYIQGTRIGDTVEFMGNSYQVVGIIEGRSSKLFGGVLVPYPAMSYVSGVREIQHRFIIPIKELEHGEGLVAKSKENPYIHIFTVTTLAEEDRIAEEIYAQQNVKMLLTGGCVCLFAFFSLFAITLGRSLEEQKIVGIHKAVGAKGSMLFAQALIQNIVIVAAALAVDRILLSLPLEKIFVTQVQYSFMCVMQAVGIGLVLALMMSIFSVVTAAKNVRQMLDRQRR
ncbi:MAG TPA: ABC transporter permease [Candidatus Scybalocola faecigallinarum]|uniref:ABC transporter permease n=1 Tax=Candidatus Scybalocola faecigallinarum TaxID=2840941 RepID=A0A9D1F3N8_9FIRM|nr:ABC transporter permease [Candidatus Scybalocola faecigallinarum]